MTPVLCTLARTALFYESLVVRLSTIVNQKDTHLAALQEKLKDLGGSYFPRKNKAALEQFDIDAWREEQRKRVDDEQTSGRGIFEAWADIDDATILDWQALAKGIHGWDGELVYF
jgi:hypothetical protein